MHSPSTPIFRLRAGRPEDAPALVALKRDTIQRVNSRDYSPEQIAAWLPGEDAVAAMPARLAGRHVVVAEDGGMILGFGDLGDDGLIDQFFVAADAQGRGVGRAILTALLAEADRRGLPSVHSHVSVTARPFFQRLGFRVEAQQTVTVRGVNLTNFRMSRERSP